MANLNLVGTTIGRFHILAELGQGGMAYVYRAHQTDLGRDVALKILRPELTYDADLVTRFAQEARSAARLDHPHIVPIYDIGELDGPGGISLHYIAMKYIPGQTARAVLHTGGPLSVAQTVNLLSQAGDALGYAHRQGVIHRDVKPSNMLIHDDGTLYLSDFGLACEMGSRSRLTRTGTVLGTPEYMSPEQAEGKTQVGPATDIYALGVVLYELLSGDVPFQADTPMAMVVARLTQPPRPIQEARADLPPALHPIVERALARDPADRYASVEALIDALRQVPPDPARPASVSPALDQASTGPTMALPRPADEPAPRRLVQVDVARHDGYRRGLSSWGYVALLVVGFLLIGGGIQLSTAFSRPDPTPTPIPPTQPPPRVVDIDGRLSAGWAAFDQARYNEAEEHFREVMLATGDEALVARGESLYGLGRVAIQRGNYDQAYEELLAAAAQEPRNAEIQAWLGEVYLRRGKAYDDANDRAAASQQFALADEAFTKAINQANQQASQGPFFRMDGRAVRAFATTGQGWVAFYQLEYERARGIFEEALALDYEQPVAHTGLGWTLQALQDYQLAYSHFTLAVQQDPTYANAYYGLGEACTKLGKIREAREAYSKALALDPANVEVQNAQERLE